MLLKFLNKTDSILALKNADSQASGELLNRDNYSYFECSNEDETKYYTFDCTKPYLAVQTISGPATPNTYFNATIIPIPAKGSSIKELYCEFGYEDGTNIIFYECDGSTSIMRVGETIPIRDDQLDNKLLFCGLGKYLISTKGKVDRSKSPLYFSAQIMTSQTESSGTIYKIKNISDFMGTTQEITNVEIYQILIISIAIIIVFIAIIVVAVTIYKRNNLNGESPDE